MFGGFCFLSLVPAEGNAAARMGSGAARSGRKGVKQRGRRAPRSASDDMLFFWNSSLETGNAHIDQQHRRLFDMTNELALLLGSGGPLPDLSGLVANLRAYATEHFRDEEAVMARSPLSAFEKDRHIRAHKAFIARVDEIAGRGDLTEVQTIEHFLEFLVTWLVMHILRMDLKIVRSITNAAVDPMGDDFSVERVLIKALSETERRFRLISDNAPTMIWISGRSGRRDFTNRAWFEYVGLDADTTASVDWDRFVHPDDIDRYRQLIADVIARPHRAEIELRIRTADGSWGWIIERIMPRIEGEACVGLVAAAGDVTMIKRSEEVLAESNRRLELEVAQRTHQLELLTLTDPLTGVGNRRVAFDRLASLAEESRGSGRPLSLLYIDIDHFKRVNDTLGHAAGDQVLIGVTHVMTATLKADHLLCRVGGEEFVAILADCDLPEAQRIAERLRVAVSWFKSEAVPRPVTISVGLATLEAGERDEDLIKRADDALLEAKRNGRNRVCTWSAAIVQSA
jgi:diguanylate cyclase (GGDEF)-like protein/hemerythrin-like metal-binding protein/PAS domain S-box-containing protein